MAASPELEAAGSTFICDCEGWMRCACAGEPFYNEYEGKLYCVLHFPGDKDIAEFDKALKRKLAAEDFNFRGVRFPGKLQLNNFKFSKPADFSSAKFTAKADFTAVEFNEDAYFFASTFSEKAVFSSAIFKALAHFSHCTFEGKVDFGGAEFRSNAKAYFFSSTFDSEAHFTSAKFRNVAHFSHTNFNARASFHQVEFKAAAYFFLATFNSVVSFRLATFDAEVSFRSAAFNDHARFMGTPGIQVFNLNKPPDFLHTRIEKTGHVSFHTMTLHPHWFINVDGSEFDFTNVDWDWRNTSLSGELRKLEARKVTSAHQLLSIACRRLAVNAEENHRYEEASRFRFWAMDALRREKARGFTFWKLSWWYWLASGYGEKILQAFLVLLAIWFFFGVLYMTVGFEQPRSTTETKAAASTPDKFGKPIEFPRAFTYSLGVITLQKPDPKPSTTWAQTLVIFETILGPLQAALLALAIRRKFMR